MNPVDCEGAFAAYEAVRARLPTVRRRGPCDRLSDLSDLAERFDVFLLDAFGVLNIGETAIPGVPGRVAALQAAGKRVMVVSNAASYPQDVLIAKYARLGYDFGPEDVVSSRMATLSGLGDLHWGLIAAGGQGSQDLAGLRYEVLGDDPGAYDAVQGFLMLSSADWTEVRQSILEDSCARNPRPVVIGNPDIVAPREDGFSVEPGRYGHRLADATGIVPQFHGKPFASIYDLAFARLGNVDRTRALMVGDSLHTDILGGQVAGVQTALIAGHGFFAGREVRPFIEASGIAPDFVLDRP